MKKYKLNIHGNEYEVAIHSVEENTIILDVNGMQYSVQVDKQLKPVSKTPVLVRSVAVPTTDSHPSTSKTTPSVKGGVVKSPLPGVVLKVLVREGDTVKMGQKLMILEAMKMENNIDADKEGKIKLIKAKEGDAVMEGDVLIEIGE